MPSFREMFSSRSQSSNEGTGMQVVDLLWVTRLLTHLLLRHGHLFLEYHHPLFLIQTPTSLPHSTADSPPAFQLQYKAANPFENLKLSELFPHLTTDQFHI